MSREACSTVASVGGVGAAVAAAAVPTGRGCLSSGAVAARTGGGGRTILIRRWGVCSWVVVVGDVGMGMLAEGAGSRGG